MPWHDAAITYDCLCEIEVFDFILEPSDVGIIQSHQDLIPFPTIHVDFLATPRETGLR
jgi:hypothetical protein